MKIWEFLEEYENLSDARKKEGLTNIIEQAFTYGQTEFTNRVLEMAFDLEEEDGFGTDGADI